MFNPKIIFVDPYYYVSNFNFHNLKRYAKKFFGSQKIANFIEATSDRWFNHSFKIHKFFLPELIYFLKNINSNACKQLAFIISENTWYNNVAKYEDRKIPILSDFSKISEEMRINLLPYQRDFIKEYSRKQVYDLRGYLLAFEQGLGKTLTGLALMTSLKKKSVIIIAPKKTLLTVWKYHIDTFYKNKKKIYILGQNNENDSIDCDYYIVNYESMNKLFSLNISKNCGIIVDESHNFLNINSNRSQNLILLSQKLKCKDILLMSGTPLKALGTEMIPMLTVLDRRFDEDARRIFVSSFGLNSDKALKLFNNRLGILMYRKLKSEVLDLPEKFEINRKIKIPNGNKYTLDNVKILIRNFVEERQQFYRKNKKLYDDMFDEVIDYLNNTRLEKTQDYKEYIRIVTILRNNKFLDDLKLIHWVNEYEKKVIIPILPSDLKKKFLLCKSAVKYVSLKIMGEVIGGLLVKLRNEMCQQMILHGKLDDLINESAKKTILFTSYVDCVKLAEDYFNKNGFHSITVYGATSDSENVLKQFKENIEINPLIASIQTLSIGVTLTEANTIVFLNKPWRYIEYQQASDRIHRIGQDTEVYIYTLILDTGNRENLSTRMEDIETWSRKMFEGMVDNK